MANQPFTYDVTQALQVNNFSRTGYTFLGWSLDPDATNPSYSNEQTVNNLTNVDGGIVTLYAVWQANTYTVVFDGKGGLGTMANQQFTYDVTQALDENKFSKTGYTFLGWSLSTTSSTVLYADEAEVINLTADKYGTVTLYAVWKANTYTVVFDGNGGLGTMANQQFTYDVTQALQVNNFSKTGYTFLGWTKDIDGTTYDYQDGQNVENIISNANGTITLYAVWSVNNYTVRFNLHGGSLGDSIAEVSFDIPYGTSINDYFNGISKTINPSRTGYQFMKFTYNENEYMISDGKLVNDILVGIEPIVLEAHWQANTYTVKFDGKGGLGTMANQPFTYDEAKQLTKNDFSRTGYTFLGWSTTNSNSIVEYLDEALVENLTTSPNGDVILFAVWEAIKYTIIYDGNNGTGHMTYQQLVYDTTQALSPNEFRRTGYTFKGWSTTPDATTPSYDNGQNVTNLTNVDGATVTLYAVWEANTYTVKFDGNGATSGTMANQPFKYDVTQALQVNNFSKTGYTFKGWSTTKDGTTIEYLDNALVENLTTSPNGDVILFAVWEAIKYTIIYDGNGGNDVANNGVTNVKEIQTYSDNQITLQGAIFQREGYTFKGWKKEETESTQSMLLLASSNGDYDAGESVDHLSQTLNDVVVLKAVWVENRITISFVKGNETDSISYNYSDMNIITLPVFVKPGYEFNKWVIGDGNELTVDLIKNYLTTQETTSITVYPIFNDDPIDYEIEYILNGGTNNSSNPDIYTVETETITLENPTRSGYNFLGWYNGGTKVETIQKGSIGNLSLTAKWEIINYQIVYENVDNATNPNTINTFNILSSEFSLQDASKLGYTFDGWYLNSDFTGEKIANINPNEFITTNTSSTISLYAKFTRITYKVEINFNGGTYNNNEEISLDINIEDNININLSETYGMHIEITNKRFNYFDTSTNQIINNIYDIIANASSSDDGFVISLKANYISTYTLELSVNGSNTEKVYDINEVVTLETPSLEGYTFAYWQDENGNTYSANQKFVNNDETDISITLTAYFSYNISFEKAHINNEINVDKISGNTNSITSYISRIDENFSVILPSSGFESAVYTFGGWYDGTETYLPGELYNSNSNTLYAWWTPNKYQITYNTNGALLPSDANMTYTYGEGYQLPEIAKDGYRFKGWYTTSNFQEGTDLDYITTSMSGDKELYAYFEILQYTTEITIQYAPQVYYDDLLSKLNNSDFTYTKYFTYNEKYKIYTIVIEFTNNYGVSRESIYNLFKDGYEQIIDGNKYTLNGFALPDYTDTTKSTEYTLSFSIGITVTLKYQKGSNNLEDLGTISIINSGSIAEELQKRQRVFEGYSFDGWFKEDGKFDINEIVTNSTTLVAKYTPVEFTIDYIGIEVTTVIYDSGTTIKNEPDETGKKFVGWSNETGAIFTPDMKINVLYDYLDKYNKVKLEPVYKDYTITISFDSGDENATGQMNNISYSYSELSLLSTINFALGYSVEGKRFNGWKLNNEAVTLEILKNQIANSDASVVLVATWTNEEYSIKYIGAAIPDGTYTYGMEYQLPTIEKTGYTFIGWYTTSDFQEDTKLDSITTSMYGDKVLYAYFEPKTYEVKFDPNGATLYKGDEIEDGFVLPTQSGFTHDMLRKLSSNDFGRTGYRFLGWSTNPSATEATYIDGQSVINLPYDETGIVVLYAVWEIITYNINYDLVVPGNPSTYNVETETITLENPTTTRSGYNFLGWYSGQTKVKTIEKGSTGDISLVAKWEVITYTITYDVKGGTNNVANKDSYSILANITFANPTREGYTFVNWTYNGQEITSTDGRFENLVLVANWEIITYNINYDLVVSGNPSTYNVETATIILNEPEKLGYNFLGWYNGQTKVETIQKGSTGNLNLVAKWEANVYTISFAVNNDEYEQTVSSIQIEYDEYISDIPTLTLAGYRFIGWYDQTDKQVINGMIYDYTSNITLTAKWEKAIYNVTLTIKNVPTSLSNTIIAEISTNLKGYSYSIEYFESTNSIMVVIEVPYETDISSFNEDLISTEPYTVGDIDYTFGGFDTPFGKMPSGGISATGEFSTSKILVFIYVEGEGVITFEPPLENGSYTLSESDLGTYEKEGYSLSNWYSDSSYSNIYNFEITENTSKSLYAKWIPNTYSVTFNANGGTGSMNNQTLTYDESQELTANGFEYTGHTFIGWATTSDGDVVYTDHQMVINLSTKQDDVVNLYAIWSPNTYQIVFNGNGGTGNMPNQDIKYNETLELNAQQFSKIGYRFAGWAKTPNGPIDYYDCDEFTQNITNSVKLYAKWEANVYTISFDVNNEEYVDNIADIQIEYDEYISDIPNLTLDGYRFIGWYDQNDKQVVNGMIYNYTSNITLTAKWEENIYNVIFDMAGGNQVPSQNVAYGGNIDVSNIKPERLGYTFLYFEANGIEYYLSGEGKLLLADYIMTSSNITFTAKWEANTYIISYDLDGGSITLGTNPTAFEYGKISLTALLNGLKKPEKEGYTFTNWSVDVTSLPASDITITAQYSINRYLVEFDTVGGNYINPIYVEYHNLVTVPTVNKVGYEFAYFTYNGQKLDLTTFSMPAKNIVLVAQYNRLDYQITYNYMYNDLTDTLSYNVEINQILEVPTRTGYTFGGWYLDSDYEGTAIVSTAGYAESLELYAKWIKNTYQITYVLNGEINNTNPNSYDVENKVLFTSVTKDGYDFAGWYLDVNYTNEIKDTTNQVGDLVLYAKFTPITYKVTLVDGSDTTYLEYTVETLVTFDRLVKDGYTFIGWSNAEDEILVNTLGLLGDITLTAIWEVVDYSISYSLDGGTNNSNNLTSYNIENVVEFLAPTKTGYTFGGWFIDNSFTTSITSTEGYARDLLVYAKWILDEPYTITYENVENYDGSTSYTVESNVLFKTPTKAGYKFIGWEYEGNYITSTNGLTGDITVSAVWGVVDYSITYVADGGSHNNVDNYTVEDIITFLAPTKTGYTFSGWYLDSSFTTSITSTEGYAKDLVLYAKYVANTYEMSFVVDDVEMNIPSVQMNYLQVIGNNLPTLTLPYGISFVRWYYVDGNGTIVTITNATLYMWTSDVTIYAEVVDTTYNIVYETNGGINAIANVTTVKAIDIAAQPIVLQDPNRTGYTFVGWYLSADFAGERVYEITSSLLELAENGVIRLYAKYEINKYTVTYQDMDGTILKVDNNVSYGSLATTFVPSKDGKIFDNWYYNDAVYDFNTPITQDITLVAKYRIREVSTTVNIDDSLVTVVVSTIDGIGLQADVRIVITLIEENHVLNPVEELLAAFGIVARLYDIQLVDSNNNPIEPNGEVRVELTLPSKTLENDKTYTLYHIADNLAEYELMDSTIRNGNIEFYTTHFSYYAIVISDKVVSFLWLWILLGVLGVLLLQAIIIIIVKTRKYKITFISRGNIQVKSVKYKKDERVILPKPERLGYIFGGWYIDSKFSQPANIKTMPNQNIMLYAKWYEDPITIGLRVKKNK